MSTDDEPIRYEAPPRVTPLTGDELAPDPATLAAMFWLVRRYSSYAYIERCHDLLKKVRTAFAAWARTTTAVDNGSLRGTTRVLDGAVGDLEVGLGRIKSGDKTPGYDSILEAVGFREALQDPRSERGLSLGELQEHLGPAVGLALTRACAMALRIEHTLAATWTAETILADRPSLHTRPRRLPSPLPPVPPAEAVPPIATKRGVKQTGIYLPTTIRDVCPNLLFAGHRAPPLPRACERIDYAGFPDDPDEPPWTDYEYRRDEPTEWRLHWPDERYRDGLVLPDPEYLEYMDEDNAIPEGLG